VAEGLTKMATREVLPVIDSELDLADFAQGLKRMADRAVVGKIIVHIG
jgi:NADPH:quinone reductase-like Zn-dependent oxidoreductase